MIFYSFMVTGYICRHGQTEWNLKSITQGWKDSPLTDLGLFHAKNLFSKISKLGINKMAVFNAGCVDVVILCGGMGTRLKTANPMLIEMIVKINSKTKGLLN